MVPNANALLWLPDFLNFLFTTSWYKFKFWYGFQYPVFLITMMVVAAILNTSKLKNYLCAGVWGAQLALVLALAAVADPLAYWAMIYEYYYYYASEGKPAPYPIYPWMSLTTYRPIAPNNLHCFWKALELYEVASKYLKPGERVSVPDTLMALFSCKYKPDHTGNMAMKDWYWNAHLTPQKIAAILTTWLNARVFVNMYGTVRTMDIPKYIWSEVVNEAIMVRDAGYVFIMNLTKLAKLNSLLNKRVIWLNNGTFVIVETNKNVNGTKLFRAKYGLSSEDGKLVPALYDYVPKYGINNITWLEGYIYVDVNGTYAFYGSPSVLEIRIDNITLKPTKRVEVMQDFVHASYFGSLELN
ncbi:hypothetical protein [Ignicoccus hospitalis]|uniref:hypothetical protein n=1 Tax=Ignicoccus hospitalis TaxID=160233 RepID=UPI00032188C3|nr:hypothetical protein [Ignicoccus hospitalis]HIH90939.1 hypothetical protein [Desulfurococcaceae archaeon]